MYCEEEVVVELIKEWIALRDVVTGVRHHLFLPWPVAATDQRLAKIVVAVLFALDRMPLAADRVGEGDAVRTPFGQQKDQKGRRE